jgi:hypothetical protein
MRLLDEVAQSVMPLAVDLPGRGRYHLPGPAASARTLAQCPLRYVLADEVYAQCMHVVRQWPQLLDPRDPLLRLPAEGLWLEWTQPASAIVADEKPQRCGILVTSDADGRRGRMESFWHHADFGPERAQVCTEFDLDNIVDRKRGQGAQFPVSSENCPIITLQGHAVLRVYDEWLRYFRDTRSAARRMDAVIDACAQQVRLDLPTILAFCRLLRARATDESPVDRGALNHMRARNGNAPLLDHVEVSMKIAPEIRPGAGLSDRAGRAAARLHLVRGHLVNRKGALFWRSAHMRGEPTRLPIRSRTVMVSMGKAAAGGSRYF